MHFIAVIVVLNIKLADIRRGWDMPVFAQQQFRGRRGIPWYCNQQEDATYHSCTDSAFLGTFLCRQDVLMQRSHNGQKSNRQGSCENHRERLAHAFQLLAEHNFVIFPESDKWFFFHFESGCHFKSNHDQHFKPCRPQIEIVVSVYLVRGLHTFH